MKIKHINILYWLCIALIGSQASSCQKDKNEQVGESAGAVTFSVAADLHYDDNLEDKKSQFSRQTISQTSMKDKGGDFYVINEEVSLKGDSELRGSTRQSNSKKLDNSLALAPEYPADYNPAATLGPSISLPNGVKYRILVYNAAGKFVEQVDGTAGSANPPKAVNLWQNADYTYYAYSYYNKQALPAIPTNQLANPKFNVENEDFIYATGSFKTGVQKPGIHNTQVKIQFKHAMAMVQVQVNIGGFSGKADLANYVNGNKADKPYIQAAPKMLERGVFNLKQLGFEKQTTIDSVVNANVRSTYAFVPGFNATTYQGFFYTVPGGDTEYKTDFKINASIWVIQDNPSAPLKFNKTYTGKVRKGRGRFTRFDIFGFDSGIPFPKTSTSTKTNWSRGDLFYDESQGFTSLDGYTRFQHRNYVTNSNHYGSSLLIYGYTPPVASYNQFEAKYGHTYYKLGYSYPLGVTNAAPETKGNPCDGLRPNGGDLNNKWALPTFAQAKVLADYINKYSGQGQIDKSSNVNNKSAIVIVNNELNPAVQRDGRVAFELKGYGKYNSTTEKHELTDAPTFDSQGNLSTGKAYYWLAEDGNTYGYLEISFDKSVTNGKPYSAKVYKSGSNAVSEGYSEAKLQKIDALSIRCVRKN
ncbi:fimbrillin family protein [Sphingobacterium humi]|uniref:Fimbrillin family protein n=1 Tax=Sphingobacterium humi TaxID=1796905 RepID=A0A6N8KV36_9SPHI|nr:hypothetical protein [Sphingobacterium humi]MVZ60579.1 hypothetical protein [Sphingobacterium humi]